MTLSRNILYYGSDVPQPEPIALRAGPLSLIFIAGEIRNIRIGDREILRRVYVAVRDRNWRTVPTSLLNVHKTISGESFELEFEVEHKREGIDFCWRGSVGGRSDGTIAFTMEGCAKSTFWRNRIGFCVLHPSAEWAGTSCLVETVDGNRMDGEFPRVISPGKVFSRIRAISHEVLPGVWAEVRLEGDTYEMEDQRNWGDASYKTYCPPLNLPFPTEIYAGGTVAQAVKLMIQGDTSRIGSAPADEPIVVELREKSIPLPRIGLGVSSGVKELGARSLDRLRHLCPSHLRVDLKLSYNGYEPRLQSATEQALALGSVLEVSLFLTDSAQKEITELRAILDRVRPPVDTFLVFHVAEKSTTQKWRDIARSGLSGYNPAALFGVGTDAYFAELNRSKPPAFGIDVVSFSLNPQVHLADHANLIENLQAQTPMMESAHQFARGVKLAVTPITLRPRSNPDATSIESPPADGELPLHIDPRQMSLLCAVWTMGSIKSLAEAETYSATFYETVGWGGVMEAEGGSPLPARFPSLPGYVFPVYHLFADIGEFQGGKVVVCESSSPLKAQGLVLSKNGGLRIILANLTSEPQVIRLRTHAHARTFQVKIVDEHTGEWAMSSPEAFRAAAGELMAIEEEGTALHLSPFAMMRLDRI